ncbi:YicC/YloC family endoribonuclease [Pseudomonadota bacterium]
MILSMTSFARREKETEFGNLRWELRSVNHRYLDVSLRMPEELRVLETKVREQVAKRLSRGKVECGLRFTASEENRDFAIDHEAVKRLGNAMREATTLISNPAPVNMLDVLRWPGVMQVEEPDRGPLYEEAMTLLDEALDDMVANRSREGDKLKTVIEQRCTAIDGLVVQVNERLPSLREALRKKLEDRLGELKEQLEPGRLEQELALLAQKMDVDEEVDRLTAHVQEVRHVLGRDEPVGRRLDFLMQELNREANTLASKSIDADVTKVSVDLKVLIEQIREQVQNIE